MHRPTTSACRGCFTPSQTLFFVFNYGEDTARSAWATQDATVYHYGVGYQFDLSRRTALYAALAFMNNKDQARLAPGSAGYTSGFGTAFGDNTAAYQFGMRHNF